MQTLQFVILYALFLLTVWLFFLNSRANHPSWAALEHRRYAHRGLHCSADSVPENSLAAFRRAIRHGYGAELDVHLLRDGDEQKAEQCRKQFLRRIRHTTMPRCYQWTIDRMTQEKEIYESRKAKEAQE